MDVDVKPGVYVVAVSGGVDSVVLLDMLAKQKDLKLIAAHFDHGIRENSGDDRKFVEELASKYHLLFEYAEGKLGAKASEANARKARYDFLQEVQAKYKARAVITAHHQDDVLETIILNLLRGTGRKGLSSLQNTDTVKRPLLHVSKQDLLTYAKKHHLEWCEDLSNLDKTYLRNKIRHDIMPKLTADQKRALLSLHATIKEQNKEIDLLLRTYTENNQLSKKNVINFPHNVAKELVASWLRNNDIRNFDQKIIERIVLGAKTLEKGKKIPVTGQYSIDITKENLTLKSLG